LYKYKAKINLIEKFCAKFRKKIIVTNAFVQNLDPFGSGRWELCKNSISSPRCSLGQFMMCMMEKINHELKPGGIHAL
jgi:hypothetical protein